MRPIDRVMLRFFAWVWLAIVNLVVAVLVSAWHDDDAVLVILAFLLHTVYIVLTFITLKYLADHQDVVREWRQERRERR